MLMTFAWGGCLPFGVVVANRLRNVPSASKGSWFNVHWKCQRVGWIAQLIGFFVALWYCQAYASHLASGHAIVGMSVGIFGTLQPLNAAFRPHPTTPKTWTRIIFEVVHKGLGWICVLLGIANIFIGVALVRKRNYDDLVLGFSCALAAFCVSPVLMFFILATCLPNNSLSRYILGVQPQNDKVEDSDKEVDALTESPANSISTDFLGKIWRQREAQSRETSVKISPRSTLSRLPSILAATFERAR